MIKHHHRSHVITTCFNYDLQVLCSYKLTGTSFGMEVDSWMLPPFTPQTCQTKASSADFAGQTWADKGQSLGFQTSSLLNFHQTWFKSNSQWILLGFGCAVWNQKPKAEEMVLQTIHKPWKGWKRWRGNAGVEAIFEKEQYFWVVVSTISYVHPLFGGNDPIWTHIFQTGWKHQLDLYLQNFRLDVHWRSLKVLWVCKKRLLLDICLINLISFTALLGRLGSIQPISTETPRSHRADEAWQRPSDLWWFGASTRHTYSITLVQLVYTLLPGSCLSCSVMSFFRRHLKPSERPGHSYKVLRREENCEQSTAQIAWLDVMRSYESISINMEALSHLSKPAILIHSHGNLAAASGLDGPWQEHRRCLDWKDLYNLCPTGANTQGEITWLHHTPKFLIQHSII